MVCLDRWGRFVLHRCLCVDKTCRDGSCPAPFAAARAIYPIVLDAVVAVSCGGQRGELSRRQSGGNPMEPKTITNWSLKRRERISPLICFCCPFCDGELCSPLGEAGQLDDCPDCRTLFRLPAISDHEVVAKLAEYDSETLLRAPESWMWIRFIPVKLDIVLIVFSFFAGAAISRHAIGGAVLALLTLPLGIYLQRLKLDARQIARNRRNDDHFVSRAGVR
jgi:hypothetical protein